MEKTLELPINAITVLMALGAVGIVTVIGLFIFISANAFFGKND